MNTTVMNAQTEEAIVSRSNKPGQFCETSHRQHLMGMRDAIEILSGKWKIQITAVLLFKGKMRFMDLLREVDGIGAKMLSKELHDLEQNTLVSRTVYQTRPITVEYEITPYGRTLEKVIVEIVKWGMQHREKIMNAPEN